MIDWNKLTQQDDDLITKIVDRAEKLLPVHSRLNLTMDLSEAHLSCPLRLNDFLNGDRFNFVHDIVGISRHLNRITGKLEDCFCPRFALPQKD